MSEGLSPIDDWLEKGQEMYESALENYNCTKIQIEKLIQRGQAELTRINQIGAALGKPPIDVPVVPQKTAAVAKPRATKAATGSGLPPHSQASGIERGTDDEGFGDDE